MAAALRSSRCLGMGMGQTNLLLRSFGAMRLQQQQQQQPQRLMSAAAAAAAPSASAKPAKRDLTGVAADSMLKIKRFTPRTPSLRHTVLIDRSELYKGRPIKELTKGIRKKGGRGHGGKVCVRSRGGGHKRLYRFIDFKRAVLDVEGTVERLEYDPNRTCNIALVSYPNDELCYVLLPQELEVGDKVMASRTEEVEIKVGNAMPLKNLPIGTFIHNIELTPGAGGSLARAAGTTAQLLDKKTIKPNYALVRLASKEQRFIHHDCMATVGVLSNPLHKIRKLGKAGRARWLGRRPHVRGTAMNPVDHPHGGREGKGRPGRPSCSPQGLLAKGFKTRKKKKRKDMIVVPRGGIKAKATN